MAQHPSLLNRDKMPDLRIGVVYKVASGASAKITRIDGPDRIQTSNGWYHADGVFGSSEHRPTSECLNHLLYPYIITSDSIVIGPAPEALKETPKEDLWVL